jgi:hypothetical protein
LRFEILNFENDMHVIVDIMKLLHNPKAIAHVKNESNEGWFLYQVVYLGS